MFNENIYKTDFQKYKNHKDLRKYVEKENTSHTFGVNVNYHKNRWSLGVGLSFMSLKNSYNYPYTSLSLDSTSTWDITAESFWRTDTVDSYYQVIGADTLWYYVTKDIWVTEYDSTEIINVDSLLSNSNLIGEHLFQYIEIPMIFCYDVFKQHNLSIGLQTGIITSFLIKRKGQIAAFDEKNSFMKLDAYPYVNTSFSGIGGICFAVFKFFFDCEC